MLGLKEGAGGEDELLADVPFGRSRFLKFVGGGLLSAATALALRNEPADAHHLGVPYPCFGYGKCHYCSGRICTNYCSWPDGHGAGHGCPTNAQCWNTCTAFGLYRCCDWHETFPNVPQHHCICSEPWGWC